MTLCEAMDFHTNASVVCGVGMYGGWRVVTVAVVFNARAFAQMAISWSDRKTGYCLHLSDVTTMFYGLASKVRLHQTGSTPSTPCQNEQQQQTVGHRTTATARRE
jgi:apolipoprotein N-acyltransferase